MPAEAMQGKWKHCQVFARCNACVHLSQYRWKKQCKATTQSCARPSEVLSCMLHSAMDLLSLIPLSHIVTSQSGSFAVNGFAPVYNSDKRQPDPLCDSRSQSCCSCNGDKDHHLCPLGLKVHSRHCVRLAVTLRRRWGNGGGRGVPNTPYTYQGLRQESPTYSFQLQSDTWYLPLSATGFSLCFSLHLNTNNSGIELSRLWLHESVQAKHIADSFSLSPAIYSFHQACCLALSNTLSYSLLSTSVWDFPHGETQDLPNSSYTSPSLLVTEHKTKAAGSILPESHVWPAQ